MNTVFEYVPDFFINRMEATIKILKKIPDFAKSKDLTEQQILDATLAPDMFSLKKQVQTMTNDAKSFCVRFNKMEDVVWEDNENSVDDLVTRLMSAIDFMQTHPVTDFQSAHQVQVILGFKPDSYIDAQDYVRDFLIPNFYFHTTLIYAILRNQGMSLGKGDFISEINFRPLKQS